MIKAILFDLDNTLIDFMRMKKLCCEAAVSAMVGAGLKISEKKAMKILMGMYWEYGIEYEYIFQKFLRRVIGKVDYKMLATGIIAYRKVRARYLYPYPGVKPTLRRLKKKGFRLGVVSDAPRMNAWMRLVSMGIADYFDVVVCYEDTRELKPGKKPFLKALRALKVKPEECIMVGDFVERDIAGAKRLGMKTVYARYGSNEKVKKKKADYEIDRIEGLWGVLEKI